MVVKHHECLHNMQRNILQQNISNPISPNHEIDLDLEFNDINSECEIHCSNFSASSNKHTSIESY